MPCPGAGPGRGNLRLTKRLLEHDPMSLQHTLIDESFSFFMKAGRSRHSDGTRL